MKKAFKCWWDVHYYTYSEDELFRKCRKCGKEQILMDPEEQGFSGMAGGSYWKTVKPEKKYKVLH